MVGVTATHGLGIGLQVDDGLRSARVVGTNAQLPVVGPSKGGEYLTLRVTDSLGPRWSRCHAHERAIGVLQYAVVFDEWGEVLRAIYVYCADDQLELADVGQANLFDPEDPAGTLSKLTVVGVASNSARPSAKVMGYERGRWVRASLWQDHFALRGVVGD